MGLAALMLPLLLCGFGPPRVGDRLQLPDFDVQTSQMHGIQQAAVPALTAKAALLLDFASNRVLYEKASRQPLPPASTTKIMTALLTLEKGGNLDDQTTVSPQAAAEPGTRMELAQGERLTIRELMYGLLLPSGNDAAIAIAQYDAGSLAAFLERMNARATALGLGDTHFADPDGIDDTHDRMSAYDVSQLARFALTSQPLFAQIVSTAHVVLPAQPGHPAFDLTNLNQLLGSYPGADGVKTGTTPGAGQNLVGSATRSGQRLMAVVYGSQDRYADARKLLDNGFGSYVWFRAEAYVRFPLPVSFQSPGEALLPAWEASQVQAFLDPDALTATFSIAGKPVLTAPMTPNS